MEEDAEDVWSINEGVLNSRSRAVLEEPETYGEGNEKKNEVRGERRGLGSILDFGCFWPGTLIRLLQFFLAFQ